MRPISKDGSSSFPVVNAPVVDHLPPPPSAGVQPFSVEEELASKAPGDVFQVNTMSAGLGSALRLFLVPGPAQSWRVLKVRVPERGEPLEAERRRLLRELAVAKTLRDESISNRNLIRIFDAAVVGSTELRVLMELVQGPEMIQFLHKPIPLRLSLEWMRGVADALRALHGHNLLHLDVKPGNVLIDCTDVRRAVLFDFDTTCSTNVASDVEREAFGCTRENMGTNAVSISSASPELLELVSEFEDEEDDDEDDNDRSSGGETTPSTTVDDDTDSESHGGDDWWWAGTRNVSAADDGDDWNDDWGDDEGAEGEADEIDVSEDESEAEAEEEEAGGEEDENDENDSSSDSDRSSVSSSSASDTSAYSALELIDLLQRRESHESVDTFERLNPGWAASDVYSLAKTFLWLIFPNEHTGHGFDPAVLERQAALRRQLEEDRQHVLRQQGVDLRALFDRMSSKEPEDRPSLDEVIESLNRAIQSLPSLTEEQLANARRICADR